MEDINKRFILISPDAGANKKIFKIAEQIGYTGDIITCSKSRDENGKLTRVEVPILNKHLEGDAKDYIIIDDICDGGATFINIVKELKKGNKDFEWDERSKIYLIVTHGIFSKGFKELNQYFDGIYCTNSYRDVADNEYDEKTNVKQLNVF
jgi:ribose-phosphate pyrophosphokinase